MMPEPAGPGGPLAPPIFGRSVNPITTGEGRLSPPITTGTPKFFYLPASLSHQTKAFVHNKLASFSFTLSDISYYKEGMCNVHSTQTFRKNEFNLNLSFRPIFGLT